MKTITYVEILKLAYSKLLEKSDKEERRAFELQMEGKSNKYALYNLNKINNQIEEISQEIIKAE